MPYKPGDNVRLIDGRTARIIRVFAGDLYDVRFHDGDQERIDVVPEQIAGRVRRVTIWMDDPPEESDDAPR